MKKKKIVLLGSTGSVGKNVLKVIDSLEETFTVLSLSAKGNEKLLARQANKFRPAYIGLADPEKAASLKSRLNYKCTIFTGNDCLSKLAVLPQAELIVVATTGVSGLMPLWKAIEAGKNIALANKEALVIAGRLINEKARKKRVKIIPMDSEHNAIFQCLQNRNPDEIKKIILTASGGPFYRKSFSCFRKVTPGEALKHPVWKMGAKISVDSATLINKGLEVMEAQWLFGLKPSQIEIVIHPQGIFHCLVELIDGGILAFLSKPDMRIPIQYALTFPERRESFLSPLQLTRISKLEFLKPDYRRFPGLKLALKAAEMEGTMPAVFNAADEMAVEFFLKGEINFLSIPLLIDKVIKRHKNRVNPELNAIFEADAWAREECLNIMKHKKGDL